MVDHALGLAETTEYGCGNSCVLQNLPRSFGTKGITASLRTELVTPGVFLSENMGRMRLDMECKGIRVGHDLSNIGRILQAHRVISDILDAVIEKPFGDGTSHD